MPVVNQRSNNNDSKEITNVPEWHVFDITGVIGDNDSRTLTLRSNLPEGVVILSNVVAKTVICSQTVTGTLQFGGNTVSGGIAFGTTNNQVGTNSHPASDGTFDVTIDVIDGSPVTNEYEANIGLLLYNPLY